jgi:hypothetical protein
VRDLSELTAVEDPAWPHLAEMISRSPVDVQVLPGDRACGESTVLQLQVTTRSWLGAVTMSTGGLVADHGWLRIYGGSSASSPLPGLAHVNGFPEELAADWRSAYGLVIAHDVLGGVYALDLADPAARGNLRVPVSLVSGGTPGPERRQPPSGADARATRPAW